MKPTLYVMAAGMGSRYGGLKQLDPLGPSGETIMDYSIFDAVRAGFGKVVFVIRHDFEDDFRAKILSKYEGHVPVDVVFQSIDALPDGFEAPADRTKPWGTGQAVWMGRDAVKEPFAVINADDFYGRDAFEVIGKALAHHSGKPGDYCMVGFKVGNTLTENGSVSRGVCAKDADGNLSEIHERTSIHYVDGPGTPIVYDEGDTAVELAGDTPVSMNLWGFTPDYFDYTGREFARFLAAHG
ncbi:MAG: nucleotidyltransferase, partial [Candidatus Amulumruptor caecigallinarius]